MAIFNGYVSHYQRVTMDHVSDHGAVQILAASDQRLRPENRRR